MKKYLFIFAFTFFQFSEANARITVKYYLDNKGGVLTEALVTGMGAGIGSANALLQSKKQLPLFCPSPLLSINFTNMVSIIDGELSRHNLLEIENLPLGP
jgi:hypothetical protein